MKKTASSKTISFRIDGKLARKLSRKSLELRLSLHEYAREIFLDALSQQDVIDEVTEMRHEMRDVRSDIDDLRYDLGVMLSKLLIELTDADEDTVQQWMTINFSSQKGKPEIDE